MISLLLHILRRLGPAPSIVAMLLVAPAAARAAGPERVDIPAAGYSSSAAPLVGYLYPPSARETRAAIVMMHGCGGAYARDGRLNARHRMWGEYLAGLGYAALIVDSFTSRGLAELCTIPLGQRPLKEADRVGDAYAALLYLRSLPGIDAHRIGLLGWSHGGGSVLDTVTRRPPEIDGYAAAVAFYPGCRTRSQRADRFHPYAPVLVLTGASDDWTPAAPCEALASAVSARGEPMSIVVYPGAYHDFDHPALRSQRVRKDVPNGARPGEGVTLAPDEGARNDAMLRVRNHFDKYLGG